MLSLLQIKELLSAFGPLKSFHLVKDPGATHSKVIVVSGVCVFACLHRSTRDGYSGVVAVLLRAVTILQHYWCNAFIVVITVVRSFPSTRATAFASGWIPLSPRRRARD